MVATLALTLRGDRRLRLSSHPSCLTDSTVDQRAVIYSVFDGSAKDSPPTHYDKFG